MHVYRPIIIIRHCRWDNNYYRVMMFYYIVVVDVYGRTNRFRV